MVRIGRVCVPWLVGWKLMLKELERVKPCVDCLPRDIRKEEGKESLLNGERY